MAFYDQVLYYIFEQRVRVLTTPFYVQCWIIATSFAE